MKLLRLTSSDNKAYFDNTFNDDVVIPANSEVSLNSLSLELQPNIIEINATNNEITYQIKAGQGATVYLDEVSYTADSAKLNMFNDITYKLNQSLSGGTDGSESLPPTGIALGMQFKAGVVDVTYPKATPKGYSGRFSVSYALKQERQLPETSWGIENVINSGTGNATLYKRGPDGTDHTEDARVLSSYPITKGCGHARATLETYGGTGTHTERGLFMGITTDKDATTRAECEFGVQFPYDGGNFTIYHANTATSTSESTAVGSVASIEIYNGHAYGVYYEPDGSGGFDRYFCDGSTGADAAADTDAQNELSLGDDGQQVDYYFMYIFYGAEDETRINYTIWNPDAWNNSPATSHTTQVTDGTLPTPSPKAGLGYLEMHPVLSTYLGYLHNRLPISGTSQLGKPLQFWVSHEQFAGVIKADSYYVELLTMNLDSYDGYSKGRKNILAVIPQLEQASTTHNENVVIYQPSYPVFLDLKNDVPITLRTIRARILFADGSDIATQHLSVLTLIFKKKKGFERE